MVADEVRALSSRSHEFSDQVRAHFYDTKQGMNKAALSVGKMASLDMQMSMNSKGGRGWPIQRALWSSTMKRPSLFILRVMLKKRGFVVEMFNDPVAALRYFEAAPETIDLVISDQTMPGMSGAEMAIAMFARRPELPFILCTGYSDRMDEAGARALGIGAFLHKPYATGVLLAAIEGVMGP